MDFQPISARGHNTYVYVCTRIYFQTDHMNLLCSFFSFYTSFQKFVQNSFVAKIVLLEKTEPRFLGGLKTLEIFFLDPF